MSFLNQNKFYNSILNEIDNGKDTNYSFEVYGYCRAGDEARFRDFVSKFPEIKMSPLNESGNVSLSEYRLKASPRSMLALYNLLIISDSEFWIYEERQPPQAEITTVNVDIAASGVAFQLVILIMDSSCP